MEKKNENLPEFLTLAEAAELLRLKPRTIYEMVARNRIPYRRAGRILLFKIGELMEWTKTNSNY